MASSTNGSTHSPRQQFQDSVRRLGTEEIHRHRRNKSIHLKYNPYELQHVTSLRVSPRRSPYKASPTSLKQVLEEPDFGTEERNVWSRRSPSGPVSIEHSSSLTPREELVMSPGSQNVQENRLPPLQPQIIVHANSDERPKTRRGPRGSSAFEEFRNVEDEDLKEAEAALQKGKFSEGTMTSRSSAVASTWSDTDYETSSSEAEETDSDTTPKVSRKRRSGSFDLREFQPPSLTPSAIKRTLFGRREAKKERKVEKTLRTEAPVADEGKKPKKRLRKSISKLQFLGEKMRIFGSSSHDLSAQAGTNTSQAVQEEKAILEERKRKAEAAYAEQFGYKKQRDNDGLANITSSPEIPHASEFGGNQKYDSSTVRRREGTTRSRRISMGSVFDDQDAKRQSSIGEHDARKRPSRRELEKENEQLRAMLRESQTAEEQAPSYNSEPESIPPIPPLKIRRRYTVNPVDHTPVVNNSAVPENSADSDVPPLPPQHPDRRVLSTVSSSEDNSRRGRTLRSNSTGISDVQPQLEKKEPVTKTSNPLHNAPKLAPPIPDKRNSTRMAPRRSMGALPRSVSIITEEPEDEIAEEKKRSLRSRTVTTAVVGKENLVSAVTAAMADGGSKAGKKEEWQWPDDVF